MLRKLLLPFLFVAFFANMAFAQTGSIAGTVTNEKGESIPTANVLLVEINRGDATNLNGEYTIKNVEPGTYTLRVTFVGYNDYKTQVTIEAGETLTKNVTLKRSAVGLEELVVTGYGRKVGAKSVTGSIASINTKELETVPITTVSELLQGRAAGVSVQTQSGQPGAGISVQIRGSGSINAGSRPLYIVNGVQMSFANDEGVIGAEPSPLNFLDPDNIASMQVLKDAAATAIYGAAGANGVVLITTKSGFNGPTRINVSVSRGYTEAADPVSLMNTDQWFEFFTRAAANSGRANPTNWVINNVVLPYSAYSKNVTPEQLRYTDWVDFINRTGTNSEYSISFAGGNSETQFYIAGSYIKTSGKIKATKFKRYSFNASLDHNVSDKFKLGMNVSLSSSHKKGTCEDGPFVNCPTSTVIFELPFNYPYTEDGSYSTGTRFPGINIAALLNERSRTADVFSLVGNISATYDFSDAISLRYQAGIDYSNNRGRTYRSPVLQPADDGTIFTNVQYGVNFNTSATLSYRKTFNGEHNISGLVGVEYRNDRHRVLSVSARRFPGQLFNVLSTAADIQDAGGFVEGFRKAGIFANAKYNYDQRYYVGVTVRYDGSSRFGEKNRYGFFPAVSASWRISEEDFFSSSFISDLKLRASYGVTGNSLIGYYEALGLYETGLNYAGTIGLYPSQLAKPQLTWEESVKLNIGLDFGLFGGRVDGSINIYQANNEALLLEKPLPATSGFADITQNIGEVRNRGIEFIFNSTNIRTGDFIWSSTFNISYNTSEILSLSKGINSLYPTDFLPYAVGKPLTAMKLIRWAGVNPADGRPMWYDAQGNLTYKPQYPDDAVFVGKSAQADVTGGFGNTFSYKGVSLNVFFEYQFGGYAFPANLWYFSTAQVTSTITNGRVAVLTKSWQNPGDITPLPKPYIGTSYPGTFGWSRGSTNAWFSTDYIRLKTVSLSYSLPTSVTEALNINNLQLYVSAYNLVTFTKYPGYDPDVPGPTPQSSYPVGRRISAGIDITF